MNKITITLVLHALLVCSCLADDWVVHGKTFTEVVVTSSSLDRVEVSYKGGSGSFLIADLSPELRTKYAYDPAKAHQAEIDRESKRQAAEAELAKNYHPAPVPVEVTQPNLKPDHTVQIQEMKSKIDMLRMDINQKSLIKARSNYSKGGYADIIADETLQIQQLQSQITQYQKESAK